MVLLTGAGGLLGDAFCRRYATTHDIVAVCRNRVPSVPSQRESFVDPLAPAEALVENDARVFTVHAELEKPDQVERVVEVALARFGRIDLLVNNAAHQPAHPHGVVDDDAALLDVARTLEMNVTVPLRLAVRVAQMYWRDRAAENRAANRSVVNISSTAGSRVYPRQGQAVYGTSKAALNHLTRHLASEFEAFGVRVNALAPNAFPHRVPTEDVADAIARLATENVTGRVLVLDENPA